jgi:hypothetical protein
MTNHFKISATFWAHFAVASLSHVFVVLILGGLFRLAISASAFSFWEKGLMFGIAFYTAMYAVNHLTNSQGFCVLTDIENHYRSLEGMEQVGPYTPRYYSKWRDILNSLKNLTRRAP